eukprot:scaffold10257_cov38-Prasinocladus_malaysianus.AAC.1
MYEAIRANTATSKATTKSPTALVQFCKLVLCRETMCKVRTWKLTACMLWRVPYRGHWYETVDTDDP